MYGDNRLGSMAHKGRNGLSGEISAYWIDISDDGNGPTHHHTTCIRNKRSTWDNHLVSNADSQCMQCQFERNRPVCDRDCMLSTNVARIFAFEVPALLSCPVIDLSRRKNRGSSFDFVGSEFRPLGQGFIHGWPTA